MGKLYQLKPCRYATAQTVHQVGSTLEVLSNLSLVEANEHNVGRILLWWCLTSCCLIKALCRSMIMVVVSVFGNCCIAELWQKQSLKSPLLKMITTTKVDWKRENPCRHHDYWAKVDFTKTPFLMILSDTLLVSRLGLFIVYSSFINIPSFTNNFIL